MSGLVSAIATEENALLIERCSSLCNLYVGADQYQTYSGVSDVRRRLVDIDGLFRSYRTGTGYNRTFYEAIRPLISPGLLFISSTWWGVASPHLIMHKQSRIFFSAVGATFSNIAVSVAKRFASVYLRVQCRLVVAQMTSTRSDGFNTLLYLFVPIQLLSVYGALTQRMELLLLFLFNLVAIVAHLHYAICVVRRGNLSKDNCRCSLGSTDLRSSGHLRIQDHQSCETSRRSYQASLISRSSLHLVVLYLISHLSSLPQPAMKFQQWALQWCLLVRVPYIYIYTYTYILVLVRVFVERFRCG